MAQTGLHTYLPFSILKKTNKKPWFFYSILLGSAIPDIDIIIDFILNLLNTKFTSYHFNFNLTVFHSLITLILIYLSFDFLKSPNACRRHRDS